MAIEIIRRKKETIYKAVFCKNRRRTSKCFDRKIDAIQWLQNQEKLNYFGVNKAITLKQAATDWLELHSKIRKSPGAYAHDQRLVKEYINFFPNLNLDQMTPDRVEKFIRYKLETGVKAPTVNRSLQCLRAIYYYYIKKQYLLINPVAIIGLLPEPEAPYDYLSIEETHTFLAYAEEKYKNKDRWVYCLYLLALNCGLRWGEVAGLQWDKIDFQTKSIIVTRTYCKHTGQIRETTKSRKVRYVGINSSLLPELKLLHATRSRATNLVFFRNGKPLNLSNFKRDNFHKDLKEAGLRRIRFHDFRHSFASHFAMKGGNLYDLQKLLGHSEIRITERYAHLSPDSIMSKTELVSIDGKLAHVIPLREANLG